MIKINPARSVQNFIPNRETSLINDNVDVSNLFTKAMGIFSILIGPVLTLLFHN